MRLDTLGRYWVKETLGRGGFATVYLAEDPALDAQVAVKVLDETLAADASIRSRFIHEARIMRQLAAPGLVAVHDIDEQDSCPYFVMEYCERGTLSDRLAQLSRSATLSEGLQLARVLAAGVSAVHRGGVVHRDLKPHNFMIRRTDARTRTEIGSLLATDEELVLGDFGLAKIVDQAATRLTLAGGTPGYSAPEQFTGDGSVDATADVYAASVTLVAAMTGVTPERVVDHSRIAFPDDALSAAGPLEAELRRGLAFERSARQRNIDEWYESLVAAHEASGHSTVVARALTADDGAPTTVAAGEADGNELRIDHLANVRVIGQGGFSIVYAAEHSLLRQTVAVKIMPRQLRDADRRRFSRECEVMGRMSQHANVVTVLNAGYNADGAPYVMMEHVADGTLADYLERQGPVPWEAAVELMVPVAQAVGHAHEKGILHRDIKPENILLDGLTPKLTDFGIAALRDSTGSTSTHVTASWLHTAPETFDNTRDERSDLYSLVSTLYHLVAGHAPFWQADDESLSPLMKRLMTEPPPELGRDRVPPGGNELFARCLAKDPESRPRSVEELLSLLTSVQDLAGTRIPATADSAVPTAGEKSGTRVIGDDRPMVVDSTGVANLESKPAAAARPLSSITSNVSSGVDQLVGGTTWADARRRTRTATEPKASGASGTITVGLARSGSQADERQRHAPPTRHLAPVDRRRSRSSLVLAAAIVLAVVVVGGLLLAVGGGSGGRGTQVVPAEDVAAPTTATDPPAAPAALESSATEVEAPADDPADEAPTNETPESVAGETTETEDAPEPKAEPEPVPLPDPEPVPVMPSVLEMSEGPGRDLVLAALYGAGVSDGEWYHRNPTVCSEDPPGTIVEQTPAANQVIAQNDPQGQNRFYFRIAIAKDC